MSENLFTEGCIRTNSGIYFNVANPEPDQIIIEDIAHALSMIPRFGGHLPLRYSVATHSICCSLMVNIYYEKHAFAALLHDASEAYYLDIPSPLKNLIPEYKMMESALMSMIAKKFGFEYPLDNIIKEADHKCLQLEWDNLMINQDTDMFKGHTKRTIKEDKRDFLILFHELDSKRKQWL